MQIPYAKQSVTSFDSYKVKQIRTEHFKRMDILRKSIRMKSFASNFYFRDCSIKAPTELWSMQRSQLVILFNIVHLEKSEMHKNIWSFQRITLANRTRPESSRNFPQNEIS
jgi:hypothetical protein